MPPDRQPRLLADRYELISPIGRGTMGTVWRARDHSLGRDVAVKEIRQESGLSEPQRAELRERMLREGRSAARINHPSVAVVYDAIEEEGRPWIIMELVQARSLEQVIDEEGPLPPRLVAEIGSDLLGALRAAHAQGILHRDVKPGNVLLTETGRVVLTDFGIAKAAGDKNLTKTGMVIGSPGYTAPERARGEYTGPESDLWSLGATLYFAVEGRPAYERSSVAATLAALMTESADPPTQAGPLRPVLEALLEKDHATRLTAGRAASMLRAVADTPSDEPVQEGPGTGQGFVAGGTFAAPPQGHAAPPLSSPVPPPPGTPGRGPQGPHGPGPGPVPDRAPTYPPSAAVPGQGAFGANRGQGQGAFGPPAGAGAFGAPSAPPPQGAFGPAQDAGPGSGHDSASGPGPGTGSGGGRDSAFGTGTGTGSGTGHGPGFGDGHGHGSRPGSGHGSAFGAGQGPGSDGRGAGPGEVGGAERGRGPAVPGSTGDLDSGPPSGPVSGPSSGPTSGPVSGPTSRPTPAPASGPSAGRERERDAPRYDPEQTIAVSRPSGVKRTPPRHVPGPLVSPAGPQPPQGPPARGGMGSGPDSRPQAPHGPQGAPGQAPWGAGTPTQERRIPQNGYGPPGTPGAQGQAPGGPGAQGHAPGPDGYGSGAPAGAEGFGSAGAKAYAPGGPSGGQGYAPGGPGGGQGYAPGGPAGAQGYPPGGPPGTEGYAPGQPPGAEGYAPGGPGGAQGYPPGGPSGTEGYAPGQPPGAEGYAAGGLPGTEGFGLPGLGPRGPQGQAVSGPPASSYPGIPVAGVPGTGRPGRVPSMSEDGDTLGGGLGTDLFAIAGPPPAEATDSKSRARMFILVCTGALLLAVVVIFVVWALG
ncbi:serine/threonine protein kinase [Spongiactinospora sp. TRM90649]|uniref:serine/threonine-protein kinase n=1 Tax=Spongiactinospora sp. TRM90649 TaxID=3031114 RepID=UPI0023F761A9|nr:serine/threonine protein kinase [Spongiactinospora sp. TRM90649]MDF5754737.1 protein kinase [Spongiactinospora sp. TRM90649]